MATQAPPIMVGTRLSLCDVDAVARRGRLARLPQNVAQDLQRTRAELERDLDRGLTIYGVNTGFGALSDTRIEADRLAPLQLNLVRSHAAGVGPPLPDAVVRALLLLRAHTLSLGASGIPAALVTRLLELLERGVIPIVPGQGSVGASGDLAPLAHLALPLIGEGRAKVDGTPMTGAQALAAVGLEPYVLAPKEGLALINGTQVTSALGALAAWDIGELVIAADAIAAMSLDASLGTAAACDPRIHAGKPHPGQGRSAALVRSLVADSGLAASHADCAEVQDAYSFRCMPQVHGTVRGALDYAAQVISTEVNSFTDNPLVLRRQAGGYDIVSGGNFHAGAVALVMDHLAAALATLATISERRLDRLVDPRTSRGLPAFLADDPGVESGFMMVQVTAAALASECKSLSFPASVDTIPTSAGKEDHVSMGPIAGRKLRRVVAAAARVLAIEAVVAARAIDLRSHPTSEGLRRVHAVVRNHVAPTTADRAMGPEIDALADAILEGAIRSAIEVAHPLR